MNVQALTERGLTAHHLNLARSFRLAVKVDVAVAPITPARAQEVPHKLDQQRQRVVEVAAQVAAVAVAAVVHLGTAVLDQVHQVEVGALELLQH